MSSLCTEKYKKVFLKPGRFWGPFSFPTIKPAKTGTARRSNAIPRPASGGRGSSLFQKGCFPPKYYVNMFTYIFLRGGITADGQTQEGIV